MLHTHDLLNYSAGIAVLLNKGLLCRKPGIEGAPQVYVVVSLDELSMQFANVTVHMSLAAMSASKQQ
jgi:hypothetical protein